MITSDKFNDGKHYILLIKQAQVSNPSSILQVLTTIKQGGPIYFEQNKEDGQLVSFGCLYDDTLLAYKEFSGSMMEEYEFQCDDSDRPIVGQRSLIYHGGYTNDRRQKYPRIRVPVKSKEDILNVEDISQWNNAEDKYSTCIFTSTNHSISIFQIRERKCLETLIIGSCPKVEGLYIKACPSLVHIEFLQDSMKKCSSLYIEDLNTLQRIIINDSNFESHCFPLSLCSLPLLEEIIIGNDVASKCQSFTVKDCPSLIYLVIGSHSFQGADNLIIQSKYYDWNNYQNYLLSEHFHLVIKIPKKLVVSRNVD